MKNKFKKTMTALCAALILMGVFLSLPMHRAQPQSHPQRTRPTTAM